VPLNLLERYAAATWTPPFSASIPADLDEYLALADIKAIARRRLGREMHLRLYGQNALQRDHLSAESGRILWIHKGTPHVGDSLMDLAARQLLGESGLKVDLLTDTHLLPLYQADEIFEHVVDRSENLPCRSDFILLHSASSRCLVTKLRHYRRVPFAHMHGFYTGPEFNRTLFGFHRLATLLGLNESADQLNARARSVMWASDTDRQAIRRAKIPSGAMAIALGGVRDWRTYQRWSEVLDEIRNLGFSLPPIILVGAENGLAARDRLMVRHQDMGLVDRVAMHTLPEVFTLFEQCALVLAADGGLMHVAQSAGTPVLGLFARPIRPALRVTAACLTRALQAGECVDEISPHEIALQVRSAFLGGELSNGSWQQGVVDI
jgi:heptosyltransferase-2